MSKYEPAMLPTPEVALLLAKDYTEWAGVAREIDRHGTAQLYEMMSLLLKYYAKNEKELQYGKEDR